MIWLNRFEAGSQGALGLFLKPFLLCLDSSFIAFSTARSIPRGPNLQATTTAAQSRTKRPPAVAVGLLPMTAGAASASRKRRKSRATFFVGRPPRLQRSSSIQVLIGWLIRSTKCMRSSPPCSSREPVAASGADPRAALSENPDTQTRGFRSLTQAQAFEFLS
jgi:hypothetical protein